MVDLSKEWVVIMTIFISPNIIIIVITAIGLIIGTAITQLPFATQCKVMGCLGLFAAALGIFFAYMCFTCKI